MSFALLLPLLLSAQPVVIDSYLPALPTIAQTLGPASTSLTVFALAFGIGQLSTGSLADRLNRRQMLPIGFACHVLAALAGALTTTASMLTAVRVLQGFSVAAILACARAAVRDLHPIRDDLYVIAHGLTGFSFMVLIAPIPGAPVVQRVGWRWVLMGINFRVIVLWTMYWYDFAETRHEAPVQTGSVRVIFSNTDFRTWDLLATATYADVFCFLLLSSVVYIAYLGLSPELCGWMPAGGLLVYILSTTGYRRLLHRQSLAWTVQQGAAFSVIDACAQTLDCRLFPGHVWPLLVGHAICYMGHGIHQPCGQVGAVGELSHLAGRAVSWSGLVTMLAASCLGQTTAAFDDASHSPGAWPMVVPMMSAGAVLTTITFPWPPKLQHQPNV